MSGSPFSPRKAPRSSEAPQLLHGRPCSASTHAAGTRGETPGVPYASERTWGEASEAQASVDVLRHPFVLHRLSPPHPHRTRVAYACRAVGCLLRGARDPPAVHDNWRWDDDVVWGEVVHTPRVVCIHASWRCDAARRSSAVPPAASAQRGATTSSTTCRRWPRTVGSTPVCA